MSTLKKTFYLILSASLLSCAKDESSPKKTEALMTPPNPFIELADIRSEGCLNLEKYLKALRANLQQPVRQITTNVHMTPFKNHSISHKFSLRLALGNFDISDILVQDLEGISPVHQQGCQSVTLLTPKGEENFEIYKYDFDSLTLKNHWNEQIRYQWLSSQSMNITHSYVAGDHLCAANSMVRVSVEKYISWNENAFNGLLPLSMINESYIDLLVEATGASKENLYVNDLAEGAPIEFSTRVLSVAKLKELKDFPMLPHWDLCH